MDTQTTEVTPVVEVTPEVTQAGEEVVPTPAE